MAVITTSIPANISQLTLGPNNSMTVGNCPETEKWVVTMVPVYIFFITVLGILLNVFILMVFCLHKKACTVAEIYLSNLAAADLLLVSCLPFWAVNLRRNFVWPFGLFLCKVVNVGIKMNTYCSIYFLVLVSIDRYVALVHTMSYGRMRRPKYAKLGCLLVWTFGLLMGVPTLIYRKMMYVCNSWECILDFSLRGWLVFEGISIIFCFIIPFSIISYCTFKIVKTLNNRVKERLDTENVERKATVLILAVLLAFMICWLPYYVGRIVEMSVRTEILEVNRVYLGTFLQIVTNLGYFNSVVNPILYVIVGECFRNKMIELFRPKSCRKTSSFTCVPSRQTTSSVKSVDVSTRAG